MKSRDYEAINYASDTTDYCNQTTKKASDKTTMMVDQTVLPPTAPQRVRRLSRSVARRADDGLTPCNSVGDSLRYQYERSTYRTHTKVRTGTVLVRW